MRQPIDGQLVVTGEFKEVAQPGSGLPDAAGVRRHIGVDLRASKGTPVYAPGAGVVTASYGDGVKSTVVEMRIDGKLWRFMHLSKRRVNVGDKVSEGQRIADSGNSGGVAAHLHVDVRKDKTAWSESLANYYDYRTVISEANAPKPSPGTGKRLYFTPIGQTATFYREAGGTFAMKIKDASYNWLVLEDHGNYVVVNSASAGGRCRVYLKYTATGQTIPGRYVK